MAVAARGHVMLMTVDEFLAYDFPDDIKKVELVRGELRMSPGAASPHSGVIYNLVWLLMAHVKPARLGRVFGDGVCYELVQLPRTVRMPDASFVRADRLPPEGLVPGVFKFSPDLAVEVLSPSERRSQIQKKVDDYLQSGTALIWVVDPRRRTVRIVTAGAAEKLLREGDTLTGGTVLPEFFCAVDDIFEGIARQA